jgi:hypothetical protein
MDIQEEMSSKTGRHQWNKEQSLKEATMSEEGKDIQQDVQEDRKAGGHKTNSLNFHLTM